MLNHDKLPKKAKPWAIAAMLTMLVLLMGAPVYGATWQYYLKADVTEIPKGTFNGKTGLQPAGTVQVPNEDVLMWGYRNCNSDLVTCSEVSVPGPVLYAMEGDTLIITLSNNIAPPLLPTPYPNMFSEGVTSLIINGQPTTYTPVWIAVDANGKFESVTSPASATTRPAGDVTSRVRSFNAECTAGSHVNYTWGPLKAGTYLYQSGTHPSVQVQMGLYGTLVVYPKNPANLAAANISSTVVNGVTTYSPAAPAWWAYSDRTIAAKPLITATAYNFEQPLLFSAIDQEVHASVASGMYTQAPPDPPGVALRGQMTSTINYNPNFFLVNGWPFPYAPGSPSPYLLSATGLPAPAQPATGMVPALGTPTAGQTTLLRYLNADLREKTPTLLNQYQALIADDGGPFAYTATAGGAATYYTKQQASFLLGPGQTMDALVNVGPTQMGNKSMVIFDRSLNLAIANSAASIVANTSAANPTGGAGAINGGSTVWLPVSGAVASPAP